MILIFAKQTTQYSLKRRVDSHPKILRGKTMLDGGGCQRKAMRDRKLGTAIPVRQRAILHSRCPDFPGLERLGP